MLNCNSLPYVLESHERESTLLRKLIYNFFKGNLDFCLQPEDVEEMDWTWQQIFLDATVNSKLVKKYPISSQLCISFLKKIIEYLEPYQEVHDDFYSLLCSIMGVSNLNNFYYKHYLVGKCLDNIVTMKETHNMVVNGTTGLKTWEAALLLSDWALCNQQIFSNKKVLELGSGVGFAGITIAKLCNINSIFLTDCHNTVLKTINENIQINFANYKKEEAHDVCIYKNETKSIGVMMLDWDNLDHVRWDVNPDVIIGADIVYDPTIVQSLCKVIQRFFTNKKLEVYIASVIRNEETFSIFLKTLDTMNFSWKKIEMTKSVFIEWDENINKCIIKINK